MLGLREGEGGFVFKLLLQTVSLALSCRAKPGGSDAMWAGVPPTQLHQDNLQSARRKPAPTDPS